MGYREAIEDGIETTKKGFDTFFNIPCTKCGKGYVRSATYSRKRRYLCIACKEMEKGLSKPEEVEKKEARFQKAVNRIKAAVANYEDYRSAEKKVYETLHRAGWYRSTEEIMVAMELLQKGVRTIHQQKVGRYHVDFVLPDYKVLLEIDGKPFHNESTLGREGERDGFILLSMGVGWEMIRIDTGKINKDITKLLPSILAILADRKETKRRLKK